MDVPDGAAYAYISTDNSINGHDASVAVGDDGTATFTGLNPGTAYWISGTNREIPPGTASIPSKYVLATSTLATTYYLPTVTAFGTNSITVRVPAGATHVYLDDHSTISGIDTVKAVGSTRVVTFTGLQWGTTYWVGAVNRVLRATDVIPSRFVASQSTATPATNYYLPTLRSRGRSSITVDLPQGATHAYISPLTGVSGANVPGAYGVQVSNRRATFTHLFAGTDFWIGGVDRELRGTSDAIPSAYVLATSTVAAPTVTGRITNKISRLDANRTHDFEYSGITSQGGDGVVTWRIRSSVIADPGTISSAGLYTPPSGLTLDINVTVDLLVDGLVADSDTFLVRYVRRFFLPTLASRSTTSIAVNVPAGARYFYLSTDNVVTGRDTQSTDTSSGTVTFRGLDPDTDYWIAAASFDVNPLAQIPSQNVLATSTVAAFSGYLPTVTAFDDDSITVSLPAGATHVYLSDNSTVTRLDTVQTVGATRSATFSGLTANTDYWVGGTDRALGVGEEVPAAAVVSQRTAATTAPLPDAVAPSMTANAQNPSSVFWPNDPNIRFSVGQDGIYDGDLAFSVATTGSGRVTVRRSVVDYTLDRDDVGRTVSVTVTCSVSGNGQTAASGTTDESTLTMEFRVVP